jgi:hypothetical protein
MKNALRSQLAGDPATPASPKVNPEIDAKLNKFIAENKGLYDHYMKQEKTLLSRKLMLNRMRRAESISHKVDALREVVDSNPELKAQVDAAMAKIPANKQATAFRNVAQTAIANQAVAAQRSAVKVSA